MAWTEITRQEYDRSELKYASDTRNEEWELIAEMVCGASKVGRPRTVNMREVWNAIQYIITTGC